MRKTFARSLALFGALALGMSLTGCFGLPPLLSEDSGTEPSSEAPEADAEQQQAFFDNLAVFRQMAADSPDLPASWSAMPVTSWKESDSATRDALVEFGLENCKEKTDPGSSSSGVAPGAAQFMPWLSATYLCPDRLPEVERAFLDGINDETLKALKLSQLHGDVPTDEVLTALALCEVALDLSWKIQDDTDTGTFCWVMRINAITEDSSDADFTGMFQGEDDTSSEFEALATEMGATPGGLGGLLDGTDE